MGICRTTLALRGHLVGQNVQKWETNRRLLYIQVVRMVIIYAAMIWWTKTIGLNAAKKAVSAPSQTKSRLENPLSFSIKQNRPIILS